MIVEDDLEGLLEVDCGEVRTIQLKLDDKLLLEVGKWSGVVRLV